MDDIAGQWDSEHRPDSYEPGRPPTVEGSVSLDRTRLTMDQYYDAMRRDEDFGRFFTEDVVWTSMETGEEVSGRDAVRDHFLWLHAKAIWQSKRLLIADGAATLEGSVVGAHTEVGATPVPGDSLRLPYCIVYDVTDAGISAVRGYVFGLSQL